MPFKTGKRKGKKGPEAAPPADGVFVQPASTKKADAARPLSDKEVQLLAEIEDLKQKLGASETKRSEAEAAALASAESMGSILVPNVEEVATGRKRQVTVFDRYKELGFKDSGEPILRPIFKKVEQPTYFYKINMPPCGGADLKINGIPFFHGATYEVDLGTLRTLKEMVYRLWDHDRQIHGSDENFYRGKHAKFDPRNTISARGLQ